jgi:LPS-assembly lipoprotein
MLSLAGCGFQLRGATTIPPEMSRTYISTSDRHSVFYRKLRVGLQQAGAEMVDSPVDATAVFSIFTDVTDQRVISVSARNVPREYEIYYTIIYELNTDEATLMEERTQTLTRDYTFDETLVLGKAREEEVLRDAIADDLVRIVLIQLSSL